MGGDAPTFFGRFPGRPGPPRSPESAISARSKNQILKTQVCIAMGSWGLKIFARSASELGCSRRAYVANERLHLGS